MQPVLLLAYGRLFCWGWWRLVMSKFEPMHVVNEMPIVKGCKTLDRMNLHHRKPLMVQLFQGLFTDMWGLYQRKMRDNLLNNQRKKEQVLEWSSIRIWRAGYGCVADWAMYCQNSLWWLFHVCIIDWRNVVRSDTRASMVASSTLLCSKPNAVLLSSWKNRNPFLEFFSLFDVGMEVFGEIRFGLDGILPESVSPCGPLYIQSEQPLQHLCTSNPFYGATAHILLRGFVRRLATWYQHYRETSLVAWTRALNSILTDPNASCTEKCGQRRSRSIEYLTHTRRLWQTSLLRGIWLV